jgi:hypothetical protein
LQEKQEEEEEEEEEELLEEVSDVEGVDAETSEREGEQGDAPAAFKYEGVMQELRGNLVLAAAQSGGAGHGVPPTSTDAGDDTMAK